LSRNFVADSVTMFSDAAAALQSDVDSKAARQMECASPLIVSALGDDAPLRTVADAAGDPTKILCLLDARFASSRVMSRISSQTALYRKTYNNGDMFVFVDELASLLPSWCARDSMLLFQSRTRRRCCLRQSRGVAAGDDCRRTANKDISELTWASASTILIDEHSALKARSGGGAALSASGGLGVSQPQTTLRSTAPRQAPPTVAAMTTNEDFDQGVGCAAQDGKPPRYHCLRVLRQAWPRAWELLLQPEQSRQQNVGQDARAFHCRSRRNSVCWQRQEGQDIVYPRSNLHALLGGPQRHSPASRRRLQPSYHS
jgi:hypothetical protein